MDEENNAEMSPLISGAGIDAGSAESQDTNKQKEGLPLAQNSWAATGIQILNTMLGSGILAFPYVLAKSGIWWFTFNILFISFAVLVTSWMLVEAGKKKMMVDSNPDMLNYSHLTEAIFGHRARQLLNISIILTNMGAILSYFNVIGTLGAKVLNHWTGGQDIGISTYPGFMVMIAVLLIPLVLFRSYGDLTPISILSLLFIVVIVLFVLIEGQRENGHFDIASPSPESFFSGLEVLGTYAYAATVQQAVFEAYLSTRETEKSFFMKGSMTLAIGVGAMLLMLMAVFGYGAFGQDCDSEIMSNFNVHHRSVQVAMLLLVLHLAFYIPNSFVLLRLYLLDFFDINVLTLETTPFVLYTLGIFAIPVAIMASVPKSDVAGAFSYTLDLTGDLPTGFSCFVLPAALYIYVFDKERTWMWYSAGIIFLFGLVLMTAAPIIDTYLFIKACTSGSCDSY